MNEYEAARLALRKSLAADRSDWFRTLSGRAAEHFRNDGTAAARIEWIYHHLCATPAEAQAECLLGEAQKAASESLAIRRRLGGQDPTSAG